MHYTGSNQTICAAYVYEPDINARLNWLEGEIARDEAQRRLFRNEREREEALLMQRPFSTKEAFARFGLLLGLLPPAAIFYRAVGYGLNLDHFTNAHIGLFILCLVMNVICCLTGHAMGKVLARHVDSSHRHLRLMLVAPLLGILWGLVAGAAGGAIVFGFGAIVGVVCAVPVGAAAFTLFVPLQHLLARGGMIEARHFWPLATGITAAISASILSMKF